MKVAHHDGVTFIKSDIIRAPKSLLNLAKEINLLAKELSFKDAPNSRVKMGTLLLKARECLAAKSNFSFASWCYKNIQKADGKPFSYITIKNYMKYAKNPNLMPKERERQRKYAAKRKEAIKYLTQDAPINGTTHYEQVNRLVYAWDHATNEARGQFMGIAKLERVEK